MVAVVVVLACLATAGAVVAPIMQRRLSAQRRLTAEAEQRADRVAAELAAATTAREQAEGRAAEGAGRAAEAEAERDAALAEAAAVRAAGGVDAEVLWALERARSERTYRYSVAVGPEPSALATSSAPLTEALRIEAEAVREEVGSVVDVDVDIPGEVSAAAAVLALRAAQEMLADVVRRSEASTVRVRADGADLVVEVESVDENGAAVTAAPLPVPPSPALSSTEHGVRVHGALAGYPPG